MGSSTKPSTPPAASGLFRALREMKFIKNHGLLTFLLLLVVVSALLTRGFFDVGTLDKTLRQMLLTSLTPISLRSTSTT